MCDNQAVYIMVAALIIMPVCWLTSFKYIAYVSLFASVFIVFALITIMTYGEREYVKNPELHKNIRYIDASQLPMFFGVAVFNFEGNGVILNLHASMKEPEKFHAIMRNVLLTVITLLVLFSVASYEAFGNTIKDIVTLNLPHDSLTSSVQLLYCFGLLGSYPMQVMPALNIMEKTRCFDECSSPSEKYPYLKNILLRSLIVFLSGFTATIVPKFGLFINLTGAFACTALAFILPVSVSRVLT